MSYASEQKIKIVASIVPLADFARQVGGDNVDVVLLLPPGASPHTFEPTPKTIQEISNAKIFIKIGAGLEFWADKLIKATDRDITTIESTEGIELIQAYNQGHFHGKVQSADPHIWLDPVICIQIIKKIEKMLSRLDPANSSIYKKNASVYIKKLIDLDSEILNRVKAFRTKEFITFHSSWNYFSRRYGLSVTGVIEKGPGKEPTPKHLGKLLEELKRTKMKVVFAEPQFSTKIAEAIAQEAGAQVLILDPIGGSKGRKNYIDLMRYNLSIIEKAMK